MDGPDLGSVEGRAFDAFFRANYREVMAYACRRTDRATADDVVAETFATAWRRWDIVPVAEPLPWLYGVARKVLANKLRGNRRRAALNAELSLTLQVDRDSEEHPIVSALRALKTSDRELLLLVAWEGLSPREAATALAMRYPTFRVRYHRARRRLRDELDQQGYIGHAERAPSNHPSIGS